MSFYGKWKVVTRTPMGNAEAIWNVYEENGVAKATITENGKQAEFHTVKIDGNNFDMEVEMKAFLGKMKFHMVGSVDGDTVSGTSAMKMGSSPFTGERIVEAAAEVPVAEETTTEEQKAEAALCGSGTKKVLGISFGHNMGNSELLLREALMGAEEAGAEVKMLRFNDFEVKHCIGCQACTIKMMSKGEPNLCVQKDDFPIIREALLDCDAIIYSAPIFLIRPIASLLVMADRIGPFHDVGGLESLGMNRPGSPIDQRLFKQRCAGFISVGGAVRSQYASMGLTLMNDLTYPMHVKVVDQLMVLDANSSGQALIHDDKVARARLLGKHVAENAGKTEAEMKWCGDFDGTCPVCHGNLMTVENGDEKVTCAICGIQGTMKLVDGKMKVDFAEDDLKGSRLTKEECAYHYGEIFESLGKFQDIAQEVKKREEKYRNYDIPMIKPEK